MTRFLVMSGDEDQEAHVALGPHFPLPVEQRSRSENPQMHGHGQPGKADHYGSDEQRGGHHRTNAQSGRGLVRANPAADSAGKGHGLGAAGPERLVVMRAP